MFVSYNTIIISEKFILCDMKPNFLRNLFSNLSIFGYIYLKSR